MATARSAKTAEDPLPYVRLSINLGTAVADALKDLARRHQVSITEEVRRAISVWKYVDDSMARGDRVLIETKDGSVRELVVPR